MGIQASVALARGKRGQARFIARQQAVLREDGEASGTDHGFRDNAWQLRLPGIFFGVGKLKNVGSDSGSDST